MSEESYALTEEDEISIWRSIIYDYFANRYIKDRFDNSDSHFDYLIDISIEPWAAKSTFIYAWNPSTLKAKLRPSAKSIDAYMIEKFEDILKTSIELEEEREAYPIPENQDYLSLHSNLPDDLIERSKEHIIQLTACRDDVKRKIEEICGEDFNKKMRGIIDHPEMLI